MLSLLKKLPSMLSAEQIPLKDFVIILQRETTFKDKQLPS